MTSKTLLVATDFSESADLALGAAIQWADRLGAGLRLIHVSDVWATPLETASSQLGERIQRVNSAGLDCRSELVSRCGVPPNPEELLSVAADWLFIGTRGRAGLRELAAGSWAEAAIRTVTCPVVSVPEGAKVAKDLSTVVVGFDGSEPSVLVLAQLQKVGKELGCRRFVLVHAQTSATNDPALVAKLDPLVRTLRADGYRADQISAEATSSDLILRVAAEEAADLIAVGTHSRRSFPHLLFGSVAKAVIRGAACPVYSARWATRSHHGGKPVQAGL